MENRKFFRVTYIDCNSGKQNSTVVASASEEKARYIFTNAKSSSIVLIGIDPVYYDTKTGEIVG